MRYSKTKTRTIAISAIAVALLASACSSGGDDSGATTAAPASVSAMAETFSVTVPPETTTTTAEAAAEAEGLPAAPGTEDPEPADTAVEPAGSETDTEPEMPSSSSAPPETSEEPTATTTASTSTTTAETPSATTSTTTASPPTTSTTTTTAVDSPAVLRVRVLNGSGVAGAAGRLTTRLSEAGYAVLPASNAPQRYATSAVYYAEGWRDEAEEILETAEIGEIDGVTAMPQIFASEDAAVVVLLGTDTAPAVVREQAGLRPRPNFDVKLPLGSDVPRDRFVPGLADIQIYTPQNDNDPEVFLYIDTLARALGSLGTFADENIKSVSPRDIEARTIQKYEAAVEAVEENLEGLGFTPQNVCGAPAGYSFRDLLEPTREWDEGLKTYGGDAIFTTDRLLELHGGERINPEANLEFYIREAVQTAYDALRSAELLDETEAPQLILCEAWISPSGELPEYANALWYALLTPGIQPRESLLSQGTYHFKEISKSGNFAYLIVCHPTIGERYVWLWWRESGYRAEVTGSIQNNGCQTTYERDTYLYEDTNGAEDTFRFGFGERVFSASDLLEFPRD